MNEPILTSRLVSSSQNRRLSFLRRSDGLFFYRKEELSEWDNAPPRWIETSTSGLFAEIDIALQGSLQDRDWLEENSLQETFFDRPQLRPIGVSERDLVTLLARKNGHTQLGELGYMMVSTIDKNRSLRFEASGSQKSLVDRVSRASYRDGVDRNGSVVEITLHIAKNSPVELLIRKLDDSPIEIDPYELDTSEFRLE